MSQLWPADMTCAPETKITFIRALNNRIHFCSKKLHRYLSTRKGKMGITITHYDVTVDADRVGESHCSIHA